MIKQLHAALAAGILLAASGSNRASAEVVNAGPTAFEIKETQRVASTPDKVYAALLTPSRWWASDHTFSGNAANLMFDARAGGVMTWTLKSAAGGSELMVSYVVSGYSAQGFDSLSKGVDQVLTEQVGRLKKLLEG